MRSKWSWRTMLVAMLVASLGSVILPSPAHAVTTFGGEATGVWVFVPATGLIIKVTTGQIPASGGEVEASLLSGDIPSGATGGDVARSIRAPPTGWGGPGVTHPIPPHANLHPPGSGQGKPTDLY